ncbi:MAG: hypothetical protein KH083_00155 [Intestinibacter bartlettii]|uniref:hypothetical protein n=1 Tax=Intestinibacter bartlettii TaxID=261299 RepID=UPI00242E321F|nr:hypothetical protein [Intestinibacter bartlettii]MBS7146788.1 hypothetical protein [Intestinibacter bartlettii]
MKKRVIILMALILGIMVVGCNKAETSEQSEGISQEYKDAMSNGKSSVVEEEYDKAIDYFDLALEAKKDDKEATNLIKQLKLMLEIEESESHGAYFYQMERIDKINAIDTETDVVKKKANDYKEDVLKNIDDSIDYLEEEINDGDYEKAQKDIEDFIKECKKSDSLGEQLDRCEGLLKTCKAEKKKAEEEAKKEAEEQSKIEAEAKKSTKEKSSSSGDSFTRADAKRMLKDTFGTNEYDESKDYDTTHESYYVLGDEPQYINGKKVYHVELWDYVAEDDWWMHQTCFISKDGLE